jgi:dTDP-4-dehydrorhamnose reductase
MASAFGRILITGASGQLGSYVLRELRRRDLSATAWSRRPNVELFGYRCQSVDLCEVDQVVAAFRAAQPDVVIHVAAMSGVGDCFRDPTQARRTNNTATRLLAELTQRQPARFVYVSTDLVFSGEKQWYQETDCPAPLSVYGQTKAAAERAVLGDPHHLVLRLSLLFGPSLNGRPSFFDQQIKSLLSDTPSKWYEDEWRTPLSLQVGAQGLLAVADSDAAGILHLGGPERMSRLEMGQRLARLLGKDERLCQAASRSDVMAGEPRPRDTSLDCSLWQQMMHDFPRPEYEESLRAMGLGSPARS